MRGLQRSLRPATKTVGQNTINTNSTRKALTPTPTDTSLDILDRLTRLDTARKALELELIREQDGQEASVHQAHLHLLRVMDEVGLQVTF